MPIFNFVDPQMDGARNEGRVEGRFLTGPQVDNDPILPCLRFATELRHRDPRRAQLPQNPLPLVVHEADIQIPLGVSYPGWSSSAATLRKRRKCRGA